MHIHLILSVFFLEFIFTPEFLCLNWKLKLISFLCHFVLVWWGVWKYPVTLFQPEQLTQITLFYFWQILPFVLTCMPGRLDMNKKWHRKQQNCKSLRQSVKTGFLCFWVVFTTCWLQYSTVYWTECYGLPINSFSSMLHYVLAVSSLWSLFWR